MPYVLSVVIPTFNEELVLPEFLKRISTAVAELPELGIYELIFVDDGSVDRSRELIKEAAQANNQIRLISLSRNFGHQAALTAGLAAASGDAVVSIDADLQDPPETIIALVEEWLKGADVVLAKRQSRAGETRFKLWSAQIFYRTMGKLSSSPLSNNVGDFRLLSREVVDVLLQMNETSPYYRGLVNWVGFKRSEILYDRDERFAGETKYTLSKMMKLASSGFTSFSDRPLQLASALGLSFIGVSIIGSLATIIAKILEPSRSVAGYTSLLLAVLFLGGIQLFSIGVLGLYLSVVNHNTKNRPRYIVWHKESVRADNVSDKFRNS